MSEKFRVFGTGFDPSVVQALIRQERQLERSDVNREKAATKRRKSAERPRRRGPKDFSQN